MRSSHTTPSSTPSNDRRHDALSVLRMLYQFARDDAGADAAGLARELGISDQRAALALSDLEAAGLADAARARLTLQGLAMAVNVPPVERRARHAVAA
jgi:Mn-dependent DtxR family transcriptional regulator